MSVFKRIFYVVSRVIFIGLLFFFCSAHWVYSQSRPDSIAYKLYPLRIRQDFNINGNLTNPVWKRAKAVYISHEISPATKCPHQFRRK
jgi:hypothetical protein